MDFPDTCVLQLKLSFVTTCLVIALAKLDFTSARLAVCMLSACSITTCWAGHCLSYNCYLDPV